MGAPISSRPQFARSPRTRAPQAPRGCPERQNRPQRRGLASRSSGSKSPMGTGDLRRPPGVRLAISDESPVAVLRPAGVSESNSGGASVGYGAVIRELAPKSVCCSRRRNLDDISRLDVTVRIAIDGFGTLRRRRPQVTLNRRWSLIWVIIQVHWRCCRLIRSHRTEVAVRIANLNINAASTRD
jgi:hypothetical protein